MRERELVRVGALSVAVLAMYAAGAMLLLAFAPGHPGLLGTAILAYTLGLRHAFDADHIAAIDNTTRQLRHIDERRPVGVGFFFSIGHSAVVLGLIVVAALITHEVPKISGAAGFIGTGVSGAFLWVIGLLNLTVLLDIARVASRMRAGTYEERDLEAMPAAGGVLMRLGLGRFLRLISHSWQMLPVGVLFGLGFETASEVALLALGAGAAAAGLPFLAVLCLPIMFAAGMSSVDTLDGVLMAHAYDWALRRPTRKVFYNLTITSLSVIVALVIGTIELLHVLVSAVGLSGGLWSWLAQLDFEVLGFAVVGMFICTWLSSLIAWRLLGIEQRFVHYESARLDQGLGGRGKPIHRDSEAGRGKPIHRDSRAAWDTRQGGQGGL